MKVGCIIIIQLGWFLHTALICSWHVLFAAGTVYTLLYIITHAVITQWRMQDRKFGQMPPSSFLQFQFFLAETDFILSMLSVLYTL